MRWEGGENSGEDGRPQWVTLTAPLQFPLPLSVGGNRGGWGPSDGRAESECVTRALEGPDGHMAASSAWWLTCTGSKGMPSWGFVKRSFDPVSQFGGSKGRVLQ